MKFNNTKKFKARSNRMDLWLIFMTGFLSKQGKMLFFFLILPD